MAQQDVNYVVPPYNAFTTRISDVCPLGHAPAIECEGPYAAPLRTLFVGISQEQDVLVERFI